MAAFQALGPFISTFADPAITALLHNDNGEIVIADADLLAQRLVILSPFQEYICTYPGLKFEIIIIVSPFSN